MSQSASLPTADGGLRAAYGRFLEWVVGLLMVVLFLEVTAGVVFRTIGHPLVWYDEVASMLLAWLTFYGSALASFKRGHIGCPEIIDMMPAGTRRVFSIFAQLVVIGTHARAGIQGVLLGNTSERVLHLVQVDVATVPGPRD